MENKSTISEIKFNVLVDAISAIDIVDVIVKNPDDNNIHLYITTSNLDTVSQGKLSDVCSKYTNGDIEVSYQIPTGKILGGGAKELPNTDKVCIFIEKIMKSDPSSLYSFE